MPDLPAPDRRDLDEQAYEAELASRLAALLVAEWGRRHGQDREHVKAADAADASKDVTAA